MWRLLAAIIALAGMIALPLKAADTSLSNLNPGAPVAGTDLFYDVQTTGVGGVKVTGSQIKSFMGLAPSFSGNVTFLSLTGVNQCLQINAAGVVSGTATNCGGTNAVNSVANTDGSLGIAPTTGSVIASLSPAFAVTWTTGQTFNSGLTSTTGAFTTSLTAPTVNFINLTATGTGSIAALTGSSINFFSATITTLTNTNHWTTNLTATGNGSIAALTGSSVNFVSGTITTLTSTNAWTTNLTATNRAAIAALTGSNINFLSGTITTLTGTNAWITNLTATGNGSIAALTGSSVNFVSGSITTLTDTNVWTTNLTATNAGSIAALTGSSVNFVSGTITTLTSTNGWITSLTSTNGSITTLTGGSATFQTVTVNSLTPTGPNCLQETGGIVQATNAACGSGGGSTQINAGANITTSGTASSVTINATPTGPVNAVQFVSSANGQFGGDGGFTYAGSLGTVSIAPTASVAALSIGLGSYTTGTKGLSIAGTWVSSGVNYDAPLFVNILTTSVGTSVSLAMDIQFSSKTVIGVDNIGGLLFGPSGNSAFPELRQFSDSFSNPIVGVQTAAGGGGSGYHGRDMSFGTGITDTSDYVYINGNAGGIILSSISPMTWSSNSATSKSSLNSTQDTWLARQAAGVVMLEGNAHTNAAGFDVYNTSDVGSGTPTNYERGVFDWLISANTLTIGSQAGGTGLGRTVMLVASGTKAISLSPTINLYGQSNPSANETYAVCAGSGATSLTAGGQIFVDTTTCIASSMLVKHDIAAFNDYGMIKLASLAEPLHAQRRLANAPIDIDPVAEAMALVPVVATYDTLSSNGPEFTLIAQNVCQIDERLCERTRSGEVRSFKQNAVISILVAAIQKQQAEIDEIKRELHR